MMDFTKSEYDQIEKLLKGAISHKDIEFEVRVGGSNRSYDAAPMTYYQYNNVINHLVFSKNNGGLGLKYKIETQLDIRDEETDERVTLYGDNNIKKYWLTDDLFDKEVKFSVIKKEGKETVDLDEYKTRVSSVKEVKINKSRGELTAMLSGYGNRTYRYKNRVAVTSKDGLFRFDITTLKMAEGENFRKSGVIKEVPVYELELEYVGGSGAVVKKAMKSLVKNIGILLKLYQGGSSIVKQSQVEAVLGEYRDLVGENEFVAVNPVSIHVKNIQSYYKGVTVFSKYAVTDKADGERRLLVVGKDKMVYMIDSGMNVTASGVVSSMVGTIVEGEVIPQTGVFFGYDCLFFEGEDVRDRYLNFKDPKNSRLVLLDKFVEAVNSPLIKRKIYKFGGGGRDIFEKAKDLWMSRQKRPYLCDGLIFVPQHKSYPVGGKKWPDLLKWKPPAYNSIDFLVKVEKEDTDGKAIIRPLLVQNKTAANKIKQFKTLELYVGGLRDKLDKVNKSWKKELVPVRFRPDAGKANGIGNGIGNGNSAAESEGHVAQVLLDDRGRMMAFDALHNVSQEIVDDSIVECVYLEERWVPIRVRNDKTERYKRGEKVFGNFESVANNIWLSIKKPVTTMMITTGDTIPKQIDNSGDMMNDESNYYKTMEYQSNKRLPVQHFHNKFVKKMLIESVGLLDGKENGGENKGALLDLACGKSGDLPKWDTAHFKRVVGIDIDKGCIEYSKDFYGAYKGNKPEVTYFCGDTGRLIFPDYNIFDGMGMDISEVKTMKARLEKAIPVKYAFDVVSSQFCLHYYFKSEVTLRTFLQNVTDNLKIGGHFIGTCFDGEKIFKMLKGKSFVERKHESKTIWKISKDYGRLGFPSGKANYGREISVFITSIGKTHKEYLVNTEYLVTLAKSYGLELVKMESFEDVFGRVDKKNKNYGQIEGMSEEEKEMSFMNVAFTFVKKKNSTPAVYKKLTKLIAASEKKVAAKNVDDVEKNMEEVTVPEGEVKIVGEEKQEVIEEIEEDLEMINEAKKKKGVKVKKAKPKAVASSAVKKPVKIKVSKKGKTAL